MPGGAGLFARLSTLRRVPGGIRRVAMPGATEGGPGGHPIAALNPPMYLLQKFLYKMHLHNTGG
jgi:hypothetical protein